MKDVDVLVVGAGPTGLMLACELATAGVRVRLLERRAEQSNLTRAFAVHARTLELLDARGLADKLVPRGVPVRAVAPVPGLAVSLTDLPTRYGMILIAPQSGTERLLDERAGELGVEIVRGAEVTGLRQDADGVEVDAGGQTYRASYVVGCDGAHSAIRGLSGIPFAGKQYDTHIMLADVRMPEPPEEAMFARNNNDGVVIAVPFGDGWFRVIGWDLTRADVPLSEPLPLEEVRDTFRRIAGTDFGMNEMRWSTRFLSERRQAAQYRSGRVFVAGDAAHVHSPIGGQGMNTGIQDAMNLGWKLAAAVHGTAPHWLLDSYTTERHLVGAKMLAMTDRLSQIVLANAGWQRHLRESLTRAVMRLGPPRRALVGRITGLGWHYPKRSRSDNAWVGRRMPDVPSAGSRLYEVMRDGRFTVVDRAGGIPVSDQVNTMVSIAGPGLPPLVLVRPDGYVAWAGSDRAALGEAVTTWCGAPATARL
jgi:2-polyprenyl-6-methoxyphenol hydroxylase-like FAD-dependent oxidoreductase